MTTGLPLVSIVIPTFNAAPYLPELCRSLQAQTMSDFEVLIGDDASTDETQDALHPFRSDRRFRFLRWNVNRGVSRGTLLLLGEVRAPYWCNPGADDVLENDYLERRTAHLEAHCQAMMAHGPARLIGPDGTAVAKTDRLTQVDVALGRMPGELDAARALRLLLQHNFVSTPSVMVRTSLSRLVLPWFTPVWQYAQDWLLWILITALGFDIVWDPEPRLRYRVHPTSLTCLPEKQALRSAETRLIPLCALSSAARYSAVAAALWQHWRRPLYELWLRRAAKLQAEGVWRDEWLEWAAGAYYGNRARRVGLRRELAVHALGIAQATWHERNARRSQLFPVGGLAALRDPLFEKP